MRIMYGNDSLALETDASDGPTTTAEDLQCWRRWGALGKLRNAIFWITDHHADGNRLREFRRFQGEQLRPDGVSMPSLQRPNDTLCSSHYHAFESACLNRKAIE